MRRRIDPGQGEQALASWRAHPRVDRAVLATAVRFTLEELGTRAPGRSVEVRVPPFGAVQCIEGPRHTRGTPPNVIETDPATWLALVCGRLRWDSACEAGSLRASGGRADLRGYLPLFTDPKPDAECPGEKALPRQTSLTRLADGGGNTVEE